MSTQLCGRDCEVGTSWGNQTLLCAGAESTLLGCFRWQVDKWSAVVVMAIKEIKGTQRVSFQNGKFIQMHALRNMAVLPRKFKYMLFFQITMV